MAGDRDSAGEAGGAVAYDPPVAGVSQQRNREAHAWVGLRLKKRPLARYVFVFTGVGIYPIVVRETARLWRQGFGLVAARWPRQAGLTLLTRRPLPSDRRPMPSCL